MIKKAPSTLRIGSQPLVKGVPMVPLTDEIIKTNNFILYQTHLNTEGCAKLKDLYKISLTSLEILALKYNLKGIFKDS